MGGVPGTTVLIKLALSLTSFSTQGKMACFKGQVQGGLGCCRCEKNDFWQDAGLGGAGHYANTDGFITCPPHYTGWAPRPEDGAVQGSFHTPVSPGREEGRRAGVGFFAQGLVRAEPLLFPRAAAPSPGAGGFSVPFLGKPGFLGCTHHGHLSPSRKHLLCCLTKLCSCGRVGVQPLAMSAVLWPSQVPRCGLEAGLPCRLPMARVLGGQGVVDD